MSSIGNYYQPNVLDFNRAYRDLSAKHVEFFEMQIDSLKELKPDTYEGQIIKYKAMNEAYYYKRYYKSVYKFYDKLC